jgi:hypothetical protein
MLCHYLVMQSSAVLIVTLQNMLAFQFKFYSYYLVFCSIQKNCQ